MKLKTRLAAIVDVSDWDALVKKVYGRPYSLQQQGGCRSRGSFSFVVPRLVADDFENETVPEVVNHPEMGVSFAAWLARDPKQELPSPKDKNSYSLEMWWVRNFYPDAQMVANDLHIKGLLDAGEYTVNIDW